MIIKPVGQWVGGWWLMCWWLADLIKQIASVNLSNTKKHR